MASNTSATTTVRNIANSYAPYSQFYRRDNGYDQSRRIRSTDPCEKKEEKSRRHLNWIDTETLLTTNAKNLSTKVENILALSALESAWGQGPFARDDGNNFSSLHAPPHWVGKTRPAARNRQLLFRLR